MEKQNKHEQWWLGETLSAAIGQSFLQHPTNCSINRISRYWVFSRNSFLETTTPSYQPLTISYETRSFLREAMHAVATQGTARMFKILQKLYYTRKDQYHSNKHLKQKDLKVKSF